MVSCIPSGFTQYLVVLRATFSLATVLKIRMSNFVTLHIKHRCPPFVFLPINWPHDLELPIFRKVCDSVLKSKLLNSFVSSLSEMSSYYQPCTICSAAISGVDDLEPLLWSLCGDSAMTQQARAESPREGNAWRNCAFIHIADGAAAETLLKAIDRSDMSEIRENFQGPPLHLVSSIPFISEAIDDNKFTTNNCNYWSLLILFLERPSGGNDVVPYSQLP